MKKYIIFSVIATLLFTACKEEKKKVDLKTGDTTEVVSDPLAQHDLKLYKQAMRRGDMVTAVYSLNSYLERDSSQAAYKDTLALLYMQGRSYEPAMIVIDEILSKRPKDTAMLKLFAQATEMYGDVGLAADKLKTLYDLTKEIKYKYYYGASLLSRGDAIEGEKLLTEIINDPQAKNEEVPYVNQKGSATMVKMSVMANFYLGLFHAQMGMKEKAIAELRRAVELDNDFYPAFELWSQLKRGK